MSAKKGPAARPEPKRPLAGRRIVVTRRPEQSAWLCARLGELGATVVELPLIEVAPPVDTKPLDDALRAVDRYDWVVFTSANAVRAASERITDLGIAERTLTNRKIASIGPSTTRALRECFPGVAVSIEPARHDAASLLKGLATDARGRRFLLPSSDRARGTLAVGLREQGAQADVVVAYRTIAPADLGQKVLEGLRQRPDLVIFASPSAVQNLLAVAEGQARRIPAAVIGLVTEEACRRAEIEVRVVASPSTAEGLVAAIARHFSHTTP
jgi:uroporphyrinogen III methyltransferase/synthase